MTLKYPIVLKNWKISINLHLDFQENDAPYSDIK